MKLLIETNKFLANDNNVDETARNFICSLLSIDPLQRLGFDDPASEDFFKELENHEFLGAVAELQ